MLANEIIATLPEHDHYVEPFAGSAAVLFAKPRSRLETLNDLDGQIVAFFRTLRERPDDLIRAVELTPYARAEYEAALEPTDDPVEAARRWMVRSIMCVGNDRTGGWSATIRRSAVGASRSRRWQLMPDRLAACAERLIGVQIECRPWDDILERFDLPGVVMFVDPPYMAETRAQTIGAYEHEMTDEDHGRLIEALRGLKRASAVVTHYPHPLYDSLGWHYCDIAVHADSATSRGRAERTERIYASHPVAHTLWSAS